MAIEILPYAGGSVELEEWLTANNLTLRVQEQQRPNWGHEFKSRWRAVILGCTQQNSGFGKTAEEAIDNYITGIQGEEIVVDNGSRRCVLQVPSGLHRKK